LERLHDTSDGQCHACRRTRDSLAALRLHIQHRVFSAHWHCSGSNDSSRRPVRPPRIRIDGKRGGPRSDRLVRHQHSGKHECTSVCFPRPLSGVGTELFLTRTFLQQGGVSFRPGRIFTARVSRALSTEVFNFGFSGNGKMETSVAQFLVEISPPPSIFIIDCSCVLVQLIGCSLSVAFASHCVSLSTRSQVEYGRCKHLSCCGSPRPGLTRTPLPPTTPPLPPIRFRIRLSLVPVTRTTSLLLSECSICERTVSLPLQLCSLR
jgi:hypothetical protein